MLYFHLIQHIEKTISVAYMGRVSSSLDLVHVAR